MPVQELLLGSGLWTPYLGGGGTVIASREGLIVGTYEPSYATTGLLAGWVKSGATGSDRNLTVFNGDMTITTPGTTVENTLVNGKIKIQAANVTISNCWVQGLASPGNGNQSLVECGDIGCVNAVIKDCVLVPQTPTYGWNMIQGHDYTIKRCYGKYTVDGFRVYNNNAGYQTAATNVQILANLVEDLALFNPDPNHSGTDNRTHNDCMQIEGGSGTQVVGNSMHGYYALSWPGINLSTSDPTTNPPNVWAPPHAYSSSGRCVTASCIQVTPNVGTVSSLTIDSNWFYGGATAVNIADTGATAGSCGTIGTITNNQFDHWHGPSGTSSTGNCIDVGAVWTVTAASNNTYNDTGNPVPVRTGLRSN